MYGEYVARFSLSDGVFLPYDHHGLDFLRQLGLLCENSIKSINQISMPIGPIPKTRACGSSKIGKMKKNETMQPPILVILFKK